MKNFIESLDRGVWNVVVNGPYDSLLGYG